MQKHARGTVWPFKTARAHLFLCGIVGRVVYTRRSRKTGSLVIINCPSGPLSGIINSFPLDSENSNKNPIHKPESVLKRDAVKEKDTATATTNKLQKHCGRGSGRGGTISEGTAPRARSSLRGEMEATGEWPPLVIFCLLSLQCRRLSP